MKIRRFNSDISSLVGKEIEVRGKDGYKAKVTKTELQYDGKVRIDFGPGIDGLTFKPEKLNDLLAGKTIKGGFTGWSKGAVSTFRLLN